MVYWHKIYGLLSEIFCQYFFISCSIVFLGRQRKFIELKTCLPSAFGHFWLKILSINANYPKMCLQSLNLYLESNYLTMIEKHE